MNFRILDGNLLEVDKMKVFKRGRNGEYMLFLRGIQIYMSKGNIDVSPLYIPFMRIITNGQLIFQFMFWRSDRCYEISLWPVLRYNKYTDGFYYDDEEDE